MADERASERWRRIGDYLARNYNGAAVSWLEFDLDATPSDAQVVGVPGVFHMLRSQGADGYAFEAPERSLKLLLGDVRELPPGTHAAFSSAVMSVERRGRPRLSLSLSLSLSLALSVTLWLSLSLPPTLCERSSFVFSA